MKSLRSSDIAFMKNILFRFISSSNFFSFVETQGDLPCNISKNMEPKDQISFLEV